jgi:hypothetical protein
MIPSILNCYVDIDETLIDDIDVTLIDDIDVKLLC